MKERNINMERVIEFADELKTIAYNRLEQKGYGKFASSHEILGIITEEYWELIEAVKSDNFKNIKHELNGIAIACILGLACIPD